MLCAPRPARKARYNLTGPVRSQPVRLVFDAAPGAAVVLGMADMGDRFRLLASEIEVVPPDAPLPNLPVARAVWKPAPDLRTPTEPWLTAGGPHTPCFRPR